MSTSEVTLRIRLQPKQSLLWKLVDDSPFTEIGFGGRRFGGKSGGVRRIQIMRRLKYANTSGCILRRTYKELFQNHIDPLFREYPITRDWWVEKHKYVQFPNGSKLFFMYAEHEVDVDSLFGSDLGDVAVEEAGLFTQREIQKMKGSVRWTGYVPTPQAPSFLPKMLYTFMPGGVSHFYLKRIFVDRDYQQGEEAANFRFIEAYGWDNIEGCRDALEKDGVGEGQFYAWSDEQRKAYWMARSPYAKMLLAISDADLRAAWLDGDWGKFEGIVFPELRDDLHNLDNFQFPYRNPQAKFVSAVDWASTGTVAALQMATDYDKFLFAIGEHYEKNRLVSEHSAKITALLREFGPQDYTLMDIPTTNLNQQDLFSIQEAFREAGLYTVQAFRSNIEIRHNLIKEYLRVDPAIVHPFTGKPGSPRLFISRKRCPNLWREIAELQRVIVLETGKVSYVGSDHALDCCEYLAKSQPKAPERPKVAPTKLPEFEFSIQAGRAFTRFDATFGKDPNADQWFPKP